MKMMKFFPFICFHLLQLALDTDCIFINTSESLEKYLEDRLSKTTGQSLYLELDSNVNYRLVNHKFTYMANVNITIISNNNYSANIYCSLNDNNKELFHPTRGLAFINSTVTMIRLIFHDCGTQLQMLPSEIVNHLNNTSPFYYAETHAAALLMAHSSMLISFVAFNSSYGFAIIGHNVINSTIEHCKVYHYTKIDKITKTHNTIGSGILLLFTNTATSSQPHNVVKFLYTTFENNIDLYSNITHCGTLTRFVSQQSEQTIHLQVPSAAGLTVIYTVQNVHIMIDKGKFLHNIGGYFGALSILHFLNSSKSTTTVSNSLFERNGKLYDKTSCYGDSLAFAWYWSLNKNHVNVTDMLKVEKTSFNNHKPGSWNQQKYFTFGVVYIEIYARNGSITFTFNRITCNNNSVNFGTACVSVNLKGRFSSSTGVNFTLRDTTANGNKNSKGKPLQIFKFQNTKRITFDRKSTFTDNIGSVIHGIDSSIHLSGQMIFTNNTALNGAGVYIERNGYLYLKQHLKARFVGNNAFLSGGAIYIKSSSHNGMCGLQTIGNHGNVTFINNTANTAGNAIFLTPMHNCINDGKYHSHWKSHFYHFFKLSKLDTQDRLLQISTSPIRYTIHFNQSYPLQLYPGHIFLIAITAHDTSERNVSSKVDIGVYMKEHATQNARVWLSQFGGNQVKENVDRTIFHLSLHTNTEKQRAAILVFSIPSLYMKTLDIEFLSCPLGFTLETFTGTCKCSQVLTTVSETVNCYINDKIIEKPFYIDFWIGGIHNKTILAISKSCPFTYCTYNPFYTYIKSTTEGMMLTDHNKKQLQPYCLHNRSGVLCGGCDTQSVVFGTSDCKECSNIWLLTIFIYAMAGIVLIVVLYAFKITLITGKFNGMIFYAQAANAGLLEILSLPYNGTNMIADKTRQCCYLFLSFLNLNLGFPLCFYDGMNQLWKTGLSLVFPVYLLSIVAVIIIISRHSTWLSNRTSHSSIQVLVTVVHLSFSKLLIILIDVFTPATVYTANGTHHVWYWDGNYSYMSELHWPLGAVALTIVCICILPYITVLTLGKFMIRYSKRGNFYLRPIYEAVHAPYKAGTEYWFAAKLLLLIIIYIIYVTFRTRDSKILYVGVASLLAVFLIAEALFRPFKTKALNLLDCWLMINISLVYISLRNGLLGFINIFALLAVVLALFTFVVVLVQHCLPTNTCFQNFLGKLKQGLQHEVSKRRNHNWQRDQLYDTDSYYESCDNFREPLMKDLDDDDVQLIRN